MIKAATAKQQWWLESGHDHCESCSYTYVYETGYRCAACDAAICSFCVDETVSVTVVCAGCKETENTEL